VGGGLGDEDATKRVMTVRGGEPTEFFGVYRDQRQLLISEAIELRNKVELSGQSPS